MSPGGAHHKPSSQPWRSFARGFSVFYLSYMSSELRRRGGRTLLTGPRSWVGVGLVVAVTALSDGLDRAQDEILQPLTGLGTDMSVTRPLDLEGNGGGGGAAGLNLSKGSRTNSRRRTVAWTSTSLILASRARAFAAPNS
jgi:hypothetical protein